MATRVRIGVTVPGAIVVRTVVVGAVVPGVTVASWAIVVRARTVVVSGRPCSVVVRTVITGVTVALLTIARRLIVGTSAVVLSADQRSKDKNAYGKKLHDLGLLVWGKRQSFKYCDDCREGEQDCKSSGDDDALHWEFPTVSNLVRFNFQAFLHYAARDARMSFMMHDLLRASNHT